MSNENVYELFDSPSTAHLKKIKQDFCIAIIEAARKSGLPQKEIASKLKITQPRVSNLMKGYVDMFSLHALVEFAFRLGLNVTLTVDSDTPTRA